MLFNATSFDDELEERSTGRALGSGKCAPGIANQTLTMMFCCLRPRKRNIPGATST